MTRRPYHREALARARALHKARHLEQEVLSTLRYDELRGMLVRGETLTLTGRLWAQHYALRHRPHDVGMWRE